VVVSNVALTSKKEYYYVCQAHKQSVEQARTTDEGGWTLVTRTKHKKPPKAVKAHEHHKLQAKSQRKSLLHFYKHTVG